MFKPHPTNGTVYAIASMNGAGKALDSKRVWIFTHKAIIDSTHKMTKVVNEELVYEWMRGTGMLN